MRVTGIDACRGGWVAVSLADGELAAVVFGRSLPALLAGDETAADETAADETAADETAGGVITGIDMPLGLLADGWRTADKLAAGLLGPRRSSVFAIPPRAVWEQGSYAAANQLCRELTGRGLSAQTWGLRARLLEANEYREIGRHLLYEVHPELAFGAMAGAPLALSPVTPGKHTPDGRERRRDLLARAGIVLPARPPAPLADVLDAAAVAWTAQRICAGTAIAVTDPGQSDDRGREIAIRY